MTQTNKQYLRPSEVSDRWGGRISVRTLANWRCAGTSPPFVKLGGSVMYPVRQLEEWESSRIAVGTFQYGAMGG